MKKTKKEDFAKSDILESNLVKKVTLEVLNEKHNALARYLGIPCVVEATEVLPGAVMTDGSVVESVDFACYRVDLKPFKGKFSKVRFTAVTDGKDVAFGMLVDKDGKVEGIANGYDAGKTNLVFSLTPKSCSLFATMPAKDGKPAWKNVTVELLADGGVIANVNGALNSLLGKIQALEAKLENCITGTPAAVNISVI